MSVALQTCRFCLKKQDGRHRTALFTVKNYGLVYDDIQIPSVYWGNRACANSVYQALLSPPLSKGLGTRLGSIPNCMIAGAKGDNAASPSWVPVSNRGSNAVLNWAECDITPQCRAGRKCEVDQ